MRHFLLLALFTALCGACGPTTQKCDTSNCSGCCDALGECQPGITGSACGNGGLICQTCPSGQCQFGICAGSSGSGGGFGGGSGGGASGGGGGASGGGTGGGASGGGTGGGGASGGGSGGGASGGGTGGGVATCSPSNCGGCCDSQGFCQAGFSATACGSSGASCASCGGTASCQSGRCVSTTGGGAGGGTGGGTTGGGTGGGATGGGTGGASGGGAGGGGGTLERNGLRLVGSATPTGYVGRLEVLSGGSWGTVCDDNFDLLDATVACRQLGFASAVTVTTFGNGTGTIWLDEVACVGSETTLLSCPNPGLGVNDCTHPEDVGIECSTQAATGGGAGGGTGGGGGTTVCTISPGTACPASVVWAPYSTPSLRPSGGYGLDACDAWMVGDGVLHWDGSSWQSSTGTGAASLLSVWAYDSRTAFATGFGGAAYRWNGSTWTSMPGLPAYSFYSVWGSSPSEVWVGGYNGSAGVAALYRWNGTNWTALPNPRTDNFGFFSVWASSATNLWTADGYYVFRWNGSSWTSYQPGLTTNSYGPVWGSGASDVWVVERTGATSNRMQRWNGSGFTSYTIPLTQQIVQLVGTGPNDVWAVDYQGNVAQFCGSTWSYRGQLTGATVGGFVIPTSGARWGVSHGNTSQLYVSP